MKAENSTLMVKNYTLTISTQGVCDIHNLTEVAETRLLESGIQNGQALFFVIGSTAGLTTVEYEPGLIRDLQEWFEKMVPPHGHYHHEKTWHDGNGFSHVRASLLRPDLTVPVMDGALVLGTWQQVILIDFDNRPRHRKILLQMSGV